MLARRTSGTSPRSPVQPNSCYPPRFGTRRCCDSASDGWVIFLIQSQQAPIPDSLQAENLEVGADIQVSPAILARIEALPGIYSNARDITSRDFNVPFEIAASYFVSADLIFLAGIYVDVNAGDPVFPVIGVHWKISDKWVIEGIPPRPQIQYILSDSVTLFAGADLREETFVVDNQFGTSRGHSAAQQRDP